MKSEIYQQDKPSLSHVNESGAAQMVDVANKAVSSRVATAQARIQFRPEVFLQLQQMGGITKKGAVLETAKIAGIMGAKNTAKLIPMCHPLMLEKCDLWFEYAQDLSSIWVYATVGVTHKTGVEMEALTAVSIAALTIIDMTKALSHQSQIMDVQVLHKTGGKHDF